MIVDINCNDYTSGYRGFNLKKLKNFNLNEISSKGYSFFMETIYQLNKKKYLLNKFQFIFQEENMANLKFLGLSFFEL